MRFREFTLPIGQNSQLNPLLWQNGGVRPKVARALTGMARHFVKFLSLNVPVKDLVLTGAQATTGYGPHSDLDLHVLVDFEALNCHPAGLQELFDAKRLLYKQQHDLSIYGIPVELGVENSRDPLKSPAYSLWSQNWTRGQEPHGPVDYDQDLVRHMTAQWSKLIHQTQQKNSLPAMKTVLKSLRQYRKQGLAQRSNNNQVCVADLVYKSLRNQGVIQDLATQIQHKEDQLLSLR